MTQRSLAAAIPELNLTLTEGQLIHRTLREGFDSGAFRSAAARRAALSRLRDTIKDYEEELTEALHQDLRKPAFESYTSEIGFCYQDIDHTLSHFESWMKVRSADVSLMLWPTTGEVHPQPKGVVLIVAPWNYPLNLAMAPLVAALAAGCCAVLKPAEDTPHTSAVIQRICEQAFASNHVQVAQGPGAQVVPMLLSAGKFDHVFYTGSTRVGKEIGARCGGELIPCTLELGGKSPAIVMNDAVLSSTIDRIIWGKCYNVGQTCVAPDYVLVQAGVYDEFLRKLKEGLIAAYGANPQSSPDLARIINDKHFERLSKLVEGATVYHGGQTDAAERFIAPTIAVDVELDGELMKEEIFGPILPVIRFDTWEEAKDIIALHPNPLAAYLFTTSEASTDAFIAEVSFGGGCINDSVIHLGIPDLPFGGVHGSGNGRYHGEAGFRTFSYDKSIARSSARLNPPTRYAPYKPAFLKAVKWILG